MTNSNFRGEFRDLRTSIEVGSSDQMKQKELRISKRQVLHYCKKAVYFIILILLLLLICCVDEKVLLKTCFCSHWEGETKSSLFNTLQLLQVFLWKKEKPGDFPTKDGRQTVSECFYCWLLQANLICDCVQLLTCESHLILGLHD